MRVCKFTPMEFETCKPKSHDRDNSLCKFTPMEFETWGKWQGEKLKAGVNLLRWSLKQFLAEGALKNIACKFTPMEFET